MQNHNTSMRMKYDFNGENFYNLTTDREDNFLYARTNDLLFPLITTTFILSDYPNIHQTHENEDASFFVSIYNEYNALRYNMYMTPKKGENKRSKHFTAPRLLTHLTAVIDTLVEHNYSELKVFQKKPFEINDSIQAKQYEPKEIFPKALWRYFLEGEIPKMPLKSNKRLELIAQMAKKKRF